MRKDEFKKLVNKLLKLRDPNDIVSKLQDISDSLLKCKIVILDKGITIYPIWVESYYNNENVFEDTSSHEKTGASLDQFKLRKHKSSWGGVDLYLGESGANYYLSELLKLAVIEENGEKELCSQIAIIDKLENCVNSELQLEPSDFKDRLDLEIVHKKRVRISENANNRDLELASLLKKTGKRASSYDVLRKKTIYI